MLICGQRRQQQSSSGTWGEGGRGGEIKEKMVMIVDMEYVVFEAKEEEIFTFLEVRIGCTHNCSFGFIVFRLPLLIFVNKYNVIATQVLVLPAIKIKIQRSSSLLN